jgi:hypothetical protein
MKILQKNTMERSVFRIGGETCTVEIIPCTIKSCNDPESIMIMSDGSRIKAKNLVAGDLLKTLSTNNTLDEVSEVVRSEEIAKPVYRIDFADGSKIIAAKNHKILTKHGWVEIKDLRPDLEVLRFDSDFDYSKEYVNHFDFNEQYAKSALIGMMLGDGSLSSKLKDGKYVGNPRFYVGHSKNQFDYLSHSSKAISPLVEVRQIRDKISGFGSQIKELITESTSKLVFLRDLFYNGNNKKIIKENIVSNLDIIALAYWFMDDGANGHNARFATHGFKEGEVGILVTALQKNFNFQSAKTVKDKKGYFSIVLDSKDTKALYELIAPHVPESMSYKIINRSVATVYDLEGFSHKFSKNGLPTHKDSRTYRKWREEFNSLPSTKVSDITYLGMQKTIEIETKSDSYSQKSYLCNGFVSHNTNGPHVSFVTVDEVDTISGEGLKAYKEISGMLDTKRGKKPIRVNISTRKSRYGLMEQQISSAEKMGKIVRRWTALEFMQKCPDEKSGTEPTLYYINMEDNLVLSPENWNKLHEQKKKEYEPVEALDKCGKCPLLPWCRGDAKRQESKSSMLKSIDEINAKILSEGADWTSAQLFNLKPSVEGIVYKEFDERTHVKNWNQMWFTLTGKEFPGECNHDIFVKKAHAMGLPFYAGIDWGWSNPNTLVVFCVDNRENVYVVKCDGMTYISRPAWMHHVKNKYHQKYRISLYFPDIADPGDAVEMKKLGLPVPSNMTKGEIMGGVQLIKKWLRVPGTSEAKLFISSEGCKQLIEEFGLYHFKTNSAGEVTEDPDTENDHWLDALRYGFQNLFGKNTVVLSNSGLDLDAAQVVDNRGHFFKPPTAAEYAKAMNIEFSSEYTTDKIGKVGRLSEIDGEEDENPTDGGFIFTV